jgi:hypothetical protein
MKLSEIMKALEEGKTIAKCLSSSKIFFKLMSVEGSTYYLKWGDTSFCRKEIQDHISFWNDEIYEIVEDPCSTET